MGPLRFNGVRFQFYSDDHAPPHVYCFYSGKQVFVALHRDGSVSLAARKDAGRIESAKRSDAKHMLEMAADHFDKVLSVWDSIHG